MSIRAGLGPRSKDVRISPTPIVTDTETVVAAGALFTIYYMMQRKHLFMNGRWWMFYWANNATGLGGSPSLYYQSSADGSTWTAVTEFPWVGVMGTGAFGFSFWFDGVYLHYVRKDEGGDGSLRYRKGTPNIDGTFTWMAAEQTCFNNAAGEVARVPTITVDSLGRPWIGFCQGVHNVDDYPKVIMTTRTDGIWAVGDTAAGFPYTLQASTNNNGGWGVSVVALTGGKVYVVYSIDTIIPIVPQLMFGKLYDGGWGAEESLSSMTPVGGFSGHDAVSVGDDVYVVWNVIVQSAVKYKLYYNRRVYGSGWIGEEQATGTIVVGGTVFSPSIHVVGTKPIIFYAINYGGNYYLQYFSRNGVTGWSAPIIWSIETGTFFDGMSLNPFNSNGRISTQIVLGRADNTSLVKFLARDIYSFIGSGTKVILLQDGYKLKDVRT